MILNIFNTLNIIITNLIPFSLNTGQANNQQTDCRSSVAFIPRLCYGKLRSRDLTMHRKVTKKLTWQNQESLFILMDPSGISSQTTSPEFSSFSFIGLPTLLFSCDSTGGFKLQLMWLQVMYPKTMERNPFFGMFAGADI